MSEIFKQFITENGNNKKDEKILEIIQGLLEKIESITEFNDRELMSISMLQNDIYLSNLLNFYVNNKKHLGRKHSKELLTALAEIGKILNPDSNGVTLK